MNYFDFSSHVLIDYFDVDLGYVAVDYASIQVMAQIQLLHL